MIAQIDRTAYLSLPESTGPRGSVFRHLLLSAMSEQLANANDRIRTVIDPRTAAHIDDETTEHTIHKASGALHGFHGGDDDLE